ncbi:hypothetical protein BC826DRAFT_301965 [Russula brevipes]|nr:hypothetical protein BC826DRAFT_739712 [Russula brevipes]KAI0295028.1 hypothetical protein BC826DRAFT_301965 [Russula brevipes]
MISRLATRPAAEDAIATLVGKIKGHRNEMETPNKNTNARFPLGKKKERVMASPGAVDVDARDAPTVVAHARVPKRASESGRSPSHSVTSTSFRVHDDDQITPAPVAQCRPTRREICDPDFSHDQN